jgi:hypothetical protein
MPYHLSKKPFQLLPYPSLNRWIYIGLTVSGIVMMFLLKDRMIGVANLGLALAFDPFNPKVTWKERPVYQKRWLIVHLAIFYTLFMTSFFLLK